MNETTATGSTAAGELDPEAIASADAAEVAEGKVRCEACPIRCFIRPGQTGSCDRYGNVDGVLTRMDPVVVLHRTIAANGRIVSFAGDIAPVLADAPGVGGSDVGDPGAAIAPTSVRLIAAGAGTTYPDYKPAPFIVSAVRDGVDTVTVVTEGIFSYCGVKVKIDTDRSVGEECAEIRYEDQPVGHVTTAEYGSQMLSIGGVHHLTGLTRHSGLATMRLIEALCEKQAVELTVTGGVSMVVQAGKPPIIEGTTEQHMRVGCGSATIGMFAGHWSQLVDEVVVIDEHITGVLSEHQAGVVLGMRPTGIKLRGRRSTPGRIFNVVEPGAGWAGTSIDDPAEVLMPFNAKYAWPGMRLLMTSTTGEDAAYFVLDDELRPVPTEIPAAVVASVERISANCEPAMCSVVFMAGAGGSLRAGTTTSPLRLTRSVRSGETTVTIGGAPVYLWPGGGITTMVDVEQVPAGSFGHVPTPAIVAPLEFTVPRDRYLALGGHAADIRQLDDVLRTERVRFVADAHGAPPAP